MWKCNGRQVRRREGNGAAWRLWTHEPDQPSLSSRTEPSTEGAADRRTKSQRAGTLEKETDPDESGKFL